jgi:threonine/homoserine/homoserine lactone efflux protein
MAEHGMLALLLASAAIMGSPGPSTLSAVAMGAAFGLMRALPYVAGLMLGTAAVLVAVAAGVVAVLAALPGAGPVLVAVSAAYVVYLAWRIGTAPVLARQSSEAAAPSLGGGVLLAVANPKAWLAIGAVFAGHTLLPGEPGRDAAAKIAVLLAMIVVIHLVWLLAGAGLARVLRDPVMGRVVNVAMAAGLVVATVLSVL